MGALWQMWSKLACNLGKRISDCLHSRNWRVLGLAELTSLDECTAPELALHIFWHFNTAGDLPDRLTV